jgi:hypothetical protein
MASVDVQGEAKSFGRAVARCFTHCFLFLKNNILKLGFRHCAFGGKLLRFRGSHHGASDLL